MGVWGNGLLQNDSAADVYNAYFSLFNSGLSHPSIITDLETRYYDNDLDDQNEYWIAVAKAEWECGVIQETTIEKIKSIIENDVHLSDRPDTKKRRSILLKFYERIKTPQAKPKHPVKPRVWKCIFQPGSCLSFTLSNGKFGAALVLENQYLGEIGADLVALLDYLEDSEPRIETFKTCQWLRLSHHSYKGNFDLVWYYVKTFRGISDRITIIGKIDPPIQRIQSNTYSAWQNLGRQITLQRDWDNNEDI